ncbi:MAG: hypothetical protein QG632_878, partial [Candidatus Dependentiae bacterium]|nr:hypothetical protein [Candidatus Dependentiae bacterium]
LGQTALMLASLDDQLAVVDSLLARGADVDLQASDGMTALLIALKKNKDDVALLLFEKGANRVPSDLRNKVVQLFSYGLQHGRIDACRAIYERSDCIDLTAGGPEFLKECVEKWKAPASVAFLLGLGVPYNECIKTQQMTAEVIVELCKQGLGEKAKSVMAEDPHFTVPQKLVAGHGASEDELWWGFDESNEENSTQIIRGSGHLELIAAWESALSRKSLS